MAVALVIWRPPVECRHRGISTAIGALGRHQHIFRDIRPLDKQSVRRQFIARRQAVPEHDRSVASLQVMHHLSDVLAQYSLPAAAHIGSYLPHQHEVDPLPSLSALQNSGLRIALPVMAEHDDGVLDFRLWSVGAWDDLCPGRHRIPVPQGAAVTPDALIVPLVAFTRRGERLGYGGGWYDRTLRFLRKTNPTIPAIGLAFACQEADLLPTDPWDERLTQIVTEHEVIVPDLALHMPLKTI